jgi:S-adenosylmethionine hydrolase
MPRTIVTLTTDFGLGSRYVAQMKGVILSRCPEACLIDLSHSIGPQNIREGAIVLADVTPRFPPGTIHVAVVDPGVGTERKLLYAEAGNQRYLAPDNGLLDLVLRQHPAARLIELTNRAYWLPDVSSTFHGRDILAPVAAHLAAGLDPAELGPPLARHVSLSWPRPAVSSTRAAGEILYVDSFGNLISNLACDNLSPLGKPEELTVEIAGRVVMGISQTYGNVPPGQLVALFDSQGRLELAVANGNAAAVLGVAAGAEIAVTRG